MKEVALQELWTYRQKPHFALTMSLIVHEVAFVDVSIFVMEGAFSMLFGFTPLTCVFVAYKRCKVNT